MLKSVGMPLLRHTVIGIRDVHVTPTCLLPVGRLFRVAFVLYRIEGSSDPRGRKSQPTLLLLAGNNERV
jgi:hypothetical protein